MAVASINASWYKSNSVHLLRDLVKNNNPNVILSAVKNPRGKRSFAKPQDDMMGYHMGRFIRSMSLTTKCRVLCFTLYALFVASTSSATEVGTTGNAALKIGVGARAAAMGNTFVAIADDVNTIYWNPSGLG